MIIFNNLPSILPLVGLIFTTIAITLLIYLKETRLLRSGNYFIA